MIRCDSETDGYSPDGKRIGFLTMIFVVHPEKRGFFMSKNSELVITNTKKIVGIAIFSAIAFVISYLEFPLFPAANFLKLDFSAVFICLAGFIFGPIAGVSVSAVKEVLCWMIKSSTGGVGEIANFIVTLGLFLLPTIVYLHKKGIKTVIVTMLIGCVIQVGLALISNRFIMFPLFMGDAAPEVFKSVWYYVLLFNLIKSVIISFVTIILYKRVSGIIKKL